MKHERERMKSILEPIRALEALGYKVKPPNHNTAGPTVAYLDGVPQDCWHIFHNLLTERQALIEKADLPTPGE